MAKATPPINNFNAGELSPLIDARFDINKYFNGCRTLQNAVPLVEGGAKKMPGTYFIEETKDSSVKSRMVGFSFSTIQTYQLEFGDEYIRFYKDHGQIVTAYADIDDFDPAIAHYKGEYVKLGQYCLLDFGSDKTLYICAAYGDSAPSTVYITVEANGTDTLEVDWAPASGTRIIIKLAKTDASHDKNTGAKIQAALRAFEPSLCGAWTVTESAAYAADRPVTSSITDQGFIGVIPNIYQCILATVASTDNTNFFPYSEIASPIHWSVVATGATVEIVTPYRTADLFELDINTQSADVLYIFHSSYPPMTLSRHSHCNWELAAMSILGTEDITKSGYGGIGRNIRLITHANPAVVTAKDFETGDGAFQDGDRIYINHVIQMEGVNQGQFIVEKVTTSTFKIKDPDTEEYFDGAAYTYNGLDGWAVKVVEKFNEAGEYPGCGTFFEQRLCLAGFINHPERINLSVSGDYTNFISDPELADGAIQWDLVSSQVDAIKWMVGKQDLMVGTEGGIWRLAAAASTAAMSQTNFDVQKQIFTGVSHVQPRVAQDSIIWVTRSAALVHLLQYDWQTNKWISPNLTRVAGHITQGATQALSGIVETAFQAEPYPIFWAIRTDGQLLGLTFEAQEQVYAWFRIVTDGEFESICVTGQEGGEDEITVIVKRTISGSTKRYVEYFKPQNFFSTLSDCFFVHCGLTWPTSAGYTTVVDGLDHLEGKTVSILADGNIHPERTVSGGKISLDYPATLIQVGLPFTTIVEPMKLNAGGGSGTSRGKKQKINRLTLCFYETIGGQYGVDQDNLFDIPFINTDPPTLLTQDVMADFAGNWGDEATISVVHEDPAPMTLLAIIPRVTVEDEK